MKKRGFLAVLAVLAVIFAVFGLFTACEDPNGSDSDRTYEVSFEANGGTPVPKVQTVAQGKKVTEPGIMTKTDYGFGGWYKEPALTKQWNFNRDVVTGNITLYAKWELATVVPGENWDAKMRWLDTNVQSRGAYIIKIDSDESISPITFSYSGKNNVSITLIGIESVRTLSLSISGSMFTVGSGVTLILADNLELQGRSSNFRSLIRVNSGANLILNEGAKITGNQNQESYNFPGWSPGGGVYVDSSGTFTMNGGEISGNTANYGGGGVYVFSGGTFTMSRGEISGNTAGRGGGVCVDDDDAFTMSGGEISGNTANYGGGVYGGWGDLIMSGGEISGNTANYGGGVHGDLIMSGGEISGNTAVYGGGGVLVEMFIKKTGGTIFGYSENDSKSNVVKDSLGAVQSNKGHAVHVTDSRSYYIRPMGKDTTSGPTDNLYFNATVMPKTYSGEWDYIEQ